MKQGRAFELLIKYLLLKIGFTEVESDNVYVYNDSPGQMVQGLGGSHNADVLLYPPVQTPFYWTTRLLIECKDYSDKSVGLPIVRGILGLREDINNFSVVDINSLNERRTKKGRSFAVNMDRYSYQVAIIAKNGFTVPAQEFASTYRIPLIVFNKMPFWGNIDKLLNDLALDAKENAAKIVENEEIRIKELAERLSQHMALAITNSGQLLFLYSEEDGGIRFGRSYTLHWEEESKPWILKSGGQKYCFQLPDLIMKSWLSDAKNDIGLKRSAIDCKEKYMSSMVVYYNSDGMTNIKMISIDRGWIEMAHRQLDNKV